MNAVKGNDGRARTGYFAMVLTMFFLGAASTRLSAMETTIDAEDADKVRLSRSLRNPERKRENHSGPEKSDDSYGALAKSGTRSAPSGQLGPGYDFWFYTADVILFNDDDLDGHYWGVDLLFDVDTYYDVAYVYAVLYLSYEGGPWNEYAATDSFPIHGASGEDEYVLVSELISGYPTGYYDLLIELFDSYDGGFLASFGPEDTSELGFLPLEDADRDDPYIDHVVVVGHGGGGAAGWWMISAMLLLLLGTTLRNNCRRWREAPVRRNNVV